MRVLGLRSWGLGLGSWVIAGAQVSAIVWTLDDPATVGGHRAERLGSPRAVTIDGIRGIEFDGTRDGLLLDTNPIAGLERFTIEVALRPALGGAVEQRFLHIQETGSEDRALLELRMSADGRWSLDTYLRDGDRQLTLLDRGRLHDADRWHVVALVYDGRSMRHYVDGVLDGEGAVRFTTLGAGRTSIGVRQNRISWFKGAIGEVRVTPEALPPERLRRIESAAPQPGSRLAGPTWARGIEGQRKADRGDGTYLNPIVSGDHPTLRSSGTPTTTT